MRVFEALITTMLVGGLLNACGQDASQQIDNQPAAASTLSQLDAPPSEPVTEEGPTENEVKKDCDDSIKFTLRYVDPESCYVADDSAEGQN